MGNINFINGGKLGDFMHGMFGLKNICRKYNTKANLYIYDIGWEIGLNNVYEELYPIIKSQKYIDNFDILTKYNISHNNINVFNTKLTDEGFINLGNYIKSPYLYKKCWTDIFLLDYNLNFSEYRWIDYDKKDSFYNDRLVINRRTSSFAKINPNFPYEYYIKNFDKKPIFISNSIKDFDIFPYKNFCDFHLINTLEQMFTIINSCKLFIGNLSAPLSIANSMDVRRIAELVPIPDIYHWLDERLYSKNIGMFLDSNTYYNL